MPLSVACNANVHVLRSAVGTRFPTRPLPARPPARGLLHGRVGTRAWGAGSVVERYAWKGFASVPSEKQPPPVALFTFFPASQSPGAPRGGTGIAALAEAPVPRGSGCQGRTCLLTHPHLCPLEKDCSAQQELLQPCCNFHSRVGGSQLQKKEGVYLDSRAGGGGWWKSLPASFSSLCAQRAQMGTEEKDLSAWSSEKLRGACCSILQGVVTSDVSWQTSHPGEEGRGGWRGEKAGPR